MERAADILGATLRRMKNPDAAPAWLNARWAVLVGDTIAAHVRPVNFANGVLRLEADSREWKLQAEMMNERLRERLNRDWRGTLVRELRVEVKHGAKLRHEFDNNYLPFLRKRAKPKP
jgi:predicted nucleic acid-binding Zn ribbon protein